MSDELTKFVVDDLVPASVAWLESFLSVIRSPDALEI